MASPPVPLDVEIVTGGHAAPRPVNGLAGADC